MPRIRNLIVDGTVVEQPIFDGQELIRWIHDGVVVWENEDKPYEPAILYVCADNYIRIIDIPNMKITVKYVGVELPAANVRFYNVAAHVTDEGIYYFLGYYYNSTSRENIGFIYNVFTNTLIQNSSSYNLIDLLDNANTGINTSYDSNYGYFHVHNITSSSDGATLLYCYGLDKEDSSRYRHEISVLTANGITVLYDWIDGSHSLAVASNEADARFVNAQRKSYDNYSEWIGIPLYDTSLDTGKFRCVYKEGTTKIIDFSQYIPDIDNINNSDIGFFIHTYHEYTFVLIAYLYSLNNLRQVVKHQLLIHNSTTNDIIYKNITDEVFSDLGELQYGSKETSQYATGYIRTSQYSSFYIDMNTSDYSGAKTYVKTFFTNSATNFYPTSPLNPSYDCGFASAFRNCILLRADLGKPKITTQYSSSTRDYYLSNAGLESIFTDTSIDPSLSGIYTLSKSIYFVIDETGRVVTQYERTTSTSDTHHDHRVYSTSVYNDQQITSAQPVSRYGLPKWLDNSETVLALGEEDQVIDRHTSLYCFNSFSRICTMDSGVDSELPDEQRYLLSPIFDRSGNILTDADIIES